MRKSRLELSKNLNKTTLFVTHDLDEAIRLGDRIAIMKDGKLVQVGTREEIVLGHVDKWRTQKRIDVISMKPRKLSAVLS